MASGNFRIKIFGRDYNLGETSSLKTADEGRPLQLILSPKSCSVGGRLDASEVGYFYRLIRFYAFPGGNADQYRHGTVP